MWPYPDSEDELNGVALEPYEREEEHEECEDRREWFKDIDDAREERDDALEWGGVDR